jgi:tRNA pseudouridine55 synthase
MSPRRARRPGTALDGVLVIDKPAGPTSHDVVLAVRRMTGERRAGHAGTLDPMASGVLVVALGLATRLVQFLSASRKTYEAELALGVETDTWDAQGTVLPGRLAGAEPEAGGTASAGWPSPARLESAVAGFRGSFDQVPPPFSAKKVGGERAYDLARRDEPVALRPARVTVHALEARLVAPDRVALSLTCSPGFYVRSLAHDLGLALGCGAHLTALRRTASGRFEAAAAIGLESLSEPGAAARLLQPLEVLLPELPSAHLTAEGALRVHHGAEVGPPALAGGAEAVAAAFARGGTVPPSHVRLFGQDGRLVALARPAATGIWPLRPAIVLR